MNILYIYLVNRIDIIDKVIESNNYNEQKQFYISFNKIEK